MQNLTPAQIRWLREAGAFEPKTFSKRREMLEQHRAIGAGRAHQPRLGGKARGKVSNTFNPRNFGVRV